MSGAPFNRARIPRPPSALAVRNQLAFMAGSAKSEPARAKPKAVRTKRAPSQWQF